MKRSNTAATDAGTVIDNPTPMVAQVDRWRQAGLTIGLVPTMGAIHDGHLSLVRRARAENDRVIVSIFVNPLQFGAGEDFERYPRSLESDVERLTSHGADLVFAPAEALMYRRDSTTRIAVHGVSEPLEGGHRPGHFEGVATVVAKLFNITKPHRAYFGQKDAQQVAVVQRMTADLDFTIDIVVCPIVREADGLAMSSRNAFLGPEERVAALCLIAALRRAEQGYRDGETDAARLQEIIVATLRAEPLASIDYAELVDPHTFVSPGLLAVLAVRIGATRLIDNHLLSEAFPDK